MTSKRQLYPMYAVEKKLGKFRTVSTSHTLKFLQKIVTPKYPPSRPGGTPENGPVMPSSVRVVALEELSSASTRETTPDQELEGTSMKSHILGEFTAARVPFSFFLLFFCFVCFFTHICFVFHRYLTLYYIIQFYYNEHRAREETNLYIKREKL